MEGYNQYKIRIEITKFGPKLIPLSTSRKKLTRTKSQNLCVRPQPRPRPKLMPTLTK